MKQKRPAAAAVKKRCGRAFFQVPAAVFFISAAGISSAYATQGHGAPEGLYVHQASHLFFILSMALLISRLKSRGLLKDTGWRYIRYSAVFFLLWSLDAFLVHFLEEHTRWIRTTAVDIHRIRIETPDPALRFWIPIYYMAKLDHLLCVPALAFLYAGLRRLPPVLPKGRETS